MIFPHVAAIVEAAQESGSGIEKIVRTIGILRDRGALPSSMCDELMDKAS